VVIKTTVGLVAALTVAILAPVSVAKAPTVFRLHVNDSAQLTGAGVRCFAQRPALLMCGAPRSRIFVQFTRTRVTVFREKDAVFSRIFRIQR
jgi:hypothetical protein